MRISDWSSDVCSSDLGSLRLLPSNKPHILSELFPELCPAGVPTGPTTYEVTRLCLPVRHGAAERLRIRNALITAMVDHALTNGITRLTGVEIGRASCRERVCQYV